MRKHIMQAVAFAFGISIAAADASSAQPVLFSNPAPNLRPPAHTDSNWSKEVTVLAIAPDGSWGTATAPFINEAIGRAIANCKTKYRGEIGCGYRFTSIRAGWSFALRCGQENILVAEKTLQAAEQAAVNSELRLRRDYYPDMPPCVRVVSVDPDGRIIAPDVVDLLRFVMHSTR